MIEWFQVNFEVRRAGGEWCVQASPIGNSDQRLRVRGEWRPWEPYPAPHPSQDGSLLEMQRVVFLELRRVLQGLERGTAPTAEELLERAAVPMKVHQQALDDAAHQCRERVKEWERAQALEEEIEAMRVADPTELAAQLIQSKKDMEELKTVVAKHLVEALKGLGTMHLSRLSVGRALALCGLDVAKEAGL